MRRNAKDLLEKSVSSFLRWLGFELPVVPVLGGMNIGCSLGCEALSSDNFARNLT